MPPPNRKNVASLTNCVNACAVGDLQCVADCENAFMTGQGNTVAFITGGKVFYDTQGGKVFISDSGTIGPTPPGY
jgi:hypothetical protein